MNDQRLRKSKWDTPSSQPTPFGMAQDASGQVSSLEAASAAAAKINAMLISKGKLKLPAPPTSVVPENKQMPNKTPPKEEKPKLEPLVAEVEINEVPIQCRNLLTKGATQEEISRLTGAAVSTRGRYMSYADRATNNMGERPLYLCVQGPTKESVDRAVDHIKRLIGDSIQPKSKERTRSRFSAPTTTGPTNVFSPMPPGPNAPPGQPIDAQVRSSSAVVRTPGVGGTPNPIVPPPAIQMAIQSAQTSGHYLQDKVFVGLEHADPSFSVRDKVQGPGNTFLQHIRAETGANVYLRGRGSGFMEPTSGREAFENLYIYVTHPKAEGLQAAKKLCENLVATIQAEYMTHQSQLFQRSAPAMAAAHMIAAVPPRPAQAIQPAAVQQPTAVGVVAQASLAMTSMAAPASLSQTLAAQQQAQAILAAQRPTVSTVMVSLPQGVAYPHLHMQAQPQLAVGNQPGMTIQARPPQPVPAPAPVPPPQVPHAPLPVASQPRLYPAQAGPPQQAQQSLTGIPAQVQVQVQPPAQAQIQVQPQHPGGLSVGQPEPVLSRPIQQPQPVKRRFREDLSPERTEHHPPPMTNLGVPPPGHGPVGMAGGIGGGQTSLLGLPRPGSPDRRLMPPPPMPPSMRDAGRKRMPAPGGLDVHGRMQSPDEPRLKRGRLVSYETGGDSDEDDEAAGRSRGRFETGPRFQGSSAGPYNPPPRGLSPTNLGLSPPGSSSIASSSYYKQERRDPGVGSSPFWMARN